jgi:hypothetical protein
MILVLQNTKWEEISGEVGRWGSLDLDGKMLFGGYVVDLLPILNWKAARNGKRWKNTIGNTVTRKRTEVPEKRKKNK